MKLVEIQDTLMGESELAGYPCTLVRLAGCNLNCKWCDTPKRNDALIGITPEDLAEQLIMKGRSTLLITGGEPFLQREELEKLIIMVWDKFKDIVIETNGTQLIGNLGTYSSVSHIVDIKTPSSGEVAKMNWDVLDELTPADEIKFVIDSVADLSYAAKVIDMNPNPFTYVKNVIIQPVLDDMRCFNVQLKEPTFKEIAEFIMNFKIPLKFQLQLHKLINMP